MPAVARTRRRSASDPPKCRGSVRTEIAAAPPASYARASDPASASTSIQPALGRLGSIPPGRIAVLESAIASHDDVTAAVAAGASAILVGEALMRAADPAAAIAGLVREPGPAARRPDRGEEEIA